MRTVCSVFRFAGFDVSHSADYPGWKPEPASEIVRTAEAVHQDVLGKKAALIAMHAGLECGVIGEKYPGMEMASIGPSMWDVHTPDEKVSIASVARFWDLLLAIIERA